ncbi:MAG TPA: hypothetical protein VGJ95_04320 [Pseudonocardiaceae bacterium]
METRLGVYPVASGEPDQYLDEQLQRRVAGQLGQQGVQHVLGAQVRLGRPCLLFPERLAQHGDAVLVDPGGRQRLQQMPGEEHVPAGGADVIQVQDHRAGGGTCVGR